MIIDDDGFVSLGLVISAKRSRATLVQLANNRARLVRNTNSRNDTLYLVRGIKDTQYLGQGPKAVAFMQLHHVLPDVATCKSYYRAYIESTNTPNQPKETS